MANGLTVPAYYNFNRDTGYLSFTNEGLITVNDQLIIVISSTYDLAHPANEAQANDPNFVNDAHIQQTEPFRVITECGPGSTAITRPTLLVLEQPANSAQASLLQSD
jgi:hypothetical protein